MHCSYLSVQSLLAVALLLVNVSFTNGADPVKLSVYMETLCTDCEHFYINQLYPVWSDLKNIMNMDITVYGKVRENPYGEGYEFQCQNGPEECHGNMMMNCAKETWSEEKFMDFGDCIMESFIGTQAGSVCADLIGEDYQPVEDCWKSIEGQQLLHDAGVKQSMLDPTLTYVPWILINDVFSEDTLEAAQKDLRKVICDAYEGVKPIECNL